MRNVRTLIGLRLDLGSCYRSLTVSGAARLAVASLLRPSESGCTVEVRGGDDVCTEGTVRLSVRLRSGVASRLTTCARECGLSQSGYLTTLIEEVSAPPLAIATVLGRSTDQIAVVASDINELIRTIRRDAASSNWIIEERLGPLLSELRQHVGLASRLMAELRPARRPLQEERDRVENQDGRI